MWSVGRKRCVGQENCRWRVACRDEKGEWVKGIVGGVWSVGAKRASGSRELSVECGLSGRKGRVGQGACRWYVVCRGEKGEWVKRPVAGMWSVVAKTLRGSRGLSVECGLVGEIAAWVKRIVGGVWSVGAKRASEPKKSHISYASNVANHHSDQNCQNPQNMIHLF